MALRENHRTGETATDQKAVFAVEGIPRIAKPLYQIPPPQSAPLARPIPRLGSHDVPHSGFVRTDVIGLWRSRLAAGGPRPESLFGMQHHDPGVGCVCLCCTLPAGQPPRHGAESRIVQDLADPRNERNSISRCSPPRAFVLMARAGVAVPVGRGNSTPGPINPTR